jgi:hypothetical protein
VEQGYQQLMDICPSNTLRGVGSIEGFASPEKVFLSRREKLASLRVI